MFENEGKNRISSCVTGILYLCCSSLYGFESLEGSANFLCFKSLNLKQSCLHAVESHLQKLINTVIEGWVGGGVGRSLKP